MNNLMLMLSFQRSQESATWRSRNSNPKLPRSQYPIAIEEVYAAELIKFFTEYVDEFMDELGVLLPEMRNASNTEQRLRELEVRKQQAINDRLRSVFITSLLMRTRQKVGGFVTSTFSGQMEALLGSKYNASGDFNDIFTTWEVANRSLIGNLAYEYLNNFSKLVTRASQGAWALDQFTAEMQKLNTYFMKARVPLTARDQIGSLNLALTRNIHQLNGVEHYIWITARDERVRGRPQGKYPKAIPSHWAMEGKICDWKNSGVYLSKDGWVRREASMPVAMPGEEIACRCIALPYVADLIQEVDSQIEEGL